MPTFPLNPYSGFKNNSLQPPVTSTAVTPPLAQLSGIQWNHLTKYGDFIINGHGTNVPPHLPDYYPKGLKANLPNYWPMAQNGYENFIKNSYIPEVFKKSNPYYIGSSTITDPTSANLKPRMASPLPKPSQKLNTKDFANTTTSIETRYGQQLNKKIGATTFMGSKETKRAKKLTGNGFTMLTQGVSKSTNTTLGRNALKTTAILALGAASGFTGSPKVFQIGSSAIQALENEAAAYTAVPFKNLKRLPFVPFADFRARKSFQTGLNKRLDGASAAARALIGGTDAVIPGLYAAASVLAGGYSVINLESTYGFGEHGTPYALRLDFTAKSAVATKWDPKKGWKQGSKFLDAVQMATPFRGDKVSVIDFKRNQTIGKAYRWVPESNPLTSLIAKLDDGAAELVDKLSGRLTKDFIKFYFTGPKLSPGNKTAADDIIVFRAILTNLTDSFNPSWSPVQFIGRADPSYNYGGFSRDINLDFTVYATDRDELKPIWRKLNALAGYTAPTYDGSSIALKGNYLRLTIGDIYYHQPIIINSLYYTLHESETTWETNVLEEPDMMEVPKQINVSLGATMITDMVPQKDGRFFSLAKEFDATTGTAVSGETNWLSDFNTNDDIKADIDSLAGATSSQKSKVAEILGITPADLDKLIKERTGGL